MLVTLYHGLQWVLSKAIKIGVTKCHIQCSVFSELKRVWRSRSQTLASQKGPIESPEFWARGSLVRCQAQLPTQQKERMAILPTNISTCTLMSTWTLCLWLFSQELISKGRLVLKPSHLVFSTSIVIRPIFCKKISYNLLKGDFNTTQYSYLNFLCKHYKGFGLILLNNSRWAWRLHVKP